jgi:hypothetical protein
MLVQKDNTSVLSRIPEREWVRIWLLFQFSYVKWYSFKKTNEEGHTVEILYVISKSVSMC